MAVVLKFHKKVAKTKKYIVHWQYRIKSTKLTINKPFFLEERGDDKTIESINDQIKNKKHMRYHTWFFSLVRKHQSALCRAHFKPLGEAVSEERNRTIYIQLSFLPIQVFYYRAIRMRSK